MSFGLQIRTQNGDEATGNLRSAQVVLAFQATTSSGTVALPAGVTAANSFAVSRPNDNNSPAECTISGGNVVWTAVSHYDATPSSNMKILVLRTK